MPDGCAWSEPTGGMFTWLRLPEHLDALALRPAATEAGVAYVPGRPFYVTDDGANEMRLSFSALDEAQLADAAQRLAGVIAARSAGQPGGRYARGPRTPRVDGARSRDRPPVTARSWRRRRPRRAGDARART